MKVIIIREHGNEGLTLLSIADNVPAWKAVELWQKESTRFQMDGTLPACTWKIAEKNNLVDAMIESGKV